LSGKLFSLFAMGVRMSRFVFSMWILLVVSAAWITLACGSHNPRPLQSITLSPASADAKDYTDGKVPFVATGHYNSAPAAVTPLQANWAAVSDANDFSIFGPVTSAVSIDQTGVAYCTVGAAGTYAVVAWDLQNPAPNVVCQSQSDFGEPGCNTVQASAQLTCP
jgi:hypothetical protein